jgi:hypothetical protein
MSELRPTLHLFCCNCSSILSLLLKCLPSYRHLGTENCFYQKALLVKAVHLSVVVTSDSLSAYTVVGEVRIREVFFCLRNDDNQSVASRRSSRRPGETLTKFLTAYMSATMHKSWLDSPQYKWKQPARNPLYFDFSAHENIWRSPMSNARKAW